MTATTRPIGANRPAGLGERTSDVVADTATALATALVSEMSEISEMSEMFVSWW
jgi:hypothetical protein